MAGHEPKTGICACCQWETDELEEVNCYARTPGAGPFTPEDEQQWAWMCLVCRSTFAGNSYQYPAQYRDEAQIMQLVAWGINHAAAGPLRGIRTGDQFSMVGLDPDRARTNVLTIDSLTNTGQVNCTITPPNAARDPWLTAIGAGDLAACITAGWYVPVPK